MYFRFPRIDMSAVSNEIKKLSRETGPIKRWIRTYSASPHTYKDMFKGEYLGKLKKLEELRKRTTLLCTLQAHCHRRFHLPDQLAAHCRSQLEIQNMFFSWDNDVPLLDMMRDMQEQFLELSGITDEFAVV